MNKYRFIADILRDSTVIGYLISNKATNEIHVVSFNDIVNLLKEGNVVGDSEINLEDNGRLDVWIPGSGVFISVEELPENCLMTTDFISNVNSNVQGSVKLHGIIDIQET